MVAVREIVANVPILRPLQSGCRQGTRQENRMTRPTLRAHPIAELVPDMTPDQYGALVDDIREHGLRTPIVMYEGMVLDGRHRARAWYDVHGNWDLPSTEFKGTPEEAIAFVRSHNIMRRHLKPSQIAYYEAQAAVFSKSRVGRPKKNAPKSPTQRQIAKEAGVDVETIALAAKAVKAAPEIGLYLREGKISVNRAIEVAKLPKEKRLDALTKPSQGTRAEPQATPDRRTNRYADGWRVAKADFESLARELHASGIYVGLHTMADGILVWIADKNALHRKDMAIKFNKEAGARDETASEWAHAMALKLFPDSPYASKRTARRRLAARARFPSAGQGRGGRIPEARRPWSKEAKEELAKMGE